MPSFVIGIDLGTTNSVLAYAPLAGEKPKVTILPIPQLVAPGVVEERTSLPSFSYLPPEQEGKSGAYDLPWRKGQKRQVRGKSCWLRVVWLWRCSSTH